MSSAALTCYTVGDNFVSSSNQYFPCGGTGNSTTSSTTGAQACCYGGDYCMEDGICHYTHTVPNGSGYYAAGCTDPTWQDAACPKACTSEYGADVVYNNATQSWNCCVSTKDSLDCQNPSNFTVEAPALSVLSTITQANTVVPSALVTGIGAISSIGANATGGSGLTANLTRSAAVNMTVTSTTSLKATLSGSSTTSLRTAGLSTAPSVTAQSSMATPTSSAPSSSSSSAAAASTNPVRLLMAGLSAMAFFGGQAIVI